MYAMMKSVPGGNMSAVSSLILKLKSHPWHVKFSFYIINVCFFQYMGGGPDSALPLGAQEAPLVMNGELY